MKQKITANFFKDENMRLKTRVHILENELTKKERLVDDLLLQQDTFQLPMQGAGSTKNNSQGQKMKLESHLTLNLKRKIKDLQQEALLKYEEMEALKKNIKVTKIAELEAEMKAYMDETTRMKA
jgi:hypothetical protein